MSFYIRKYFFPANNNENTREAIICFFGAQICHFIRQCRYILEFWAFFQTKYLQNESSWEECGFIFGNTFFFPTIMKIVMKPLFAFLDPKYATLKDIAEELLTFHFLLIFLPFLLLLAGYGS